MPPFDDLMVQNTSPVRRWPGSIARMQAVRCGMLANEPLQREIGWRLVSKVRECACQCQQALHLFGIVHPTEVAVSACDGGPPYVQRDPSGAEHLQSNGVRCEREVIASMPLARVE